MYYIEIATNSRSPLPCLQSSSKSSSLKGSSHTGNSEEDNVTIIVVVAF